MEPIKSICREVANSLGKGYSEVVYQEGICALLRKVNINYSKETVIPISIENIAIGNVRGDIVLHNNKMVIECKATDSSIKISHVPQILVYLKNLGYDRGLLVNFNQNPKKGLLEIIEVFKEGDKYKIAMNEQSENESECYMNRNGEII